LPDRPRARGICRAAAEDAVRPLGWRGLLDAWDVAGAGDGFTYSVSRPYQRIDYVMTSRDIKTTSVAVIGTEASNHFPIVADLELPHPSP
jgi:endonuclease/exonuclease/phosphatase family metal-dependent hydrolase